MLGNNDGAMKTMHNFHQVWKQYGFTPEYYNIPKNELHTGREGYPLRPGKSLYTMIGFQLITSVIWIILYLHIILVGNPKQRTRCHIRHTSLCILFKLTITCIQQQLECQIRQVSLSISISFLNGPITCVPHCVRLDRFHNVF